MSYVANNDAQYNPTTVIYLMRRKNVNVKCKNICRKLGVSRVLPSASEDGKTVSVMLLIK